MPFFCNCVSVILCALDCVQALRGYYIPHEDIKQSLCHFVAVVWRDFSLSRPQAGNKLVTNLDCESWQSSVHTLVAFALMLSFVLFIFLLLLLSAEMYTPHRFLLHHTCGIIQGNQQFLNPLKILGLKPLLKTKYVYDGISYLSSFV